MNLHKNTKYQLIITLDPSEKYGCYGVQNIETGVIEAYIGQLARAIQHADSFERDLLQPVKPPSGDEFMQALEEVFGPTSSKKKIKGGLNG